MFKLHKYSCKKCIPALLIVLFFIGLLPPNLYGQVKIKERVELNPKNSTQNPLRSLSDKWLEISIAPGRNSNEPITAGEIVDISIELCSPIFYGCLGIEMPPNQLFNATVTWNSFPGEDEDNVPYLYNNGVESFTLTNVQEGFKLKAPEYLQSYPLYATVTVSTLWDGETVIGDDEELIEQDTSIIVTFNPSTISVGDTVELVLQKMIYGGEIIPYHPLQQFEVGMLEGCINGHILVDDSTGSYFEQVTQPIYFVAADTIENDTASILLRVGLNQDWSDPYVEQTELAYKRWLARNGLSEADYPLKKVKVAPSYFESDCYTGSYVSWVYDEVDGIVNKLKIELVSYPFQEEITATPTAPVFPIRLRITNDNVGGTLKYFLEVKWTKLGRTFSATATDNVQVNTSIIDFNVNWKDEFNNDIIVGGDEIKLTVWYGPYKKTFPLNSKILGRNPDKQIIKDYIAAHYYPPILMPLSETVTEDDQKLQMQIIVLKESTFRQFKPQPGYTLVDGTDWGLCQLHKSNPTVKELWHWKENINSGIHILWGDGYDEKYHITKTRFSNMKKLFTKDGKVPRDPNREEFLKMLSHAYNSDPYYTVYEYGSKGKKGKYKESDEVVQDRKDNIEVYGDDFWTKFTDVEDGAPYPSGW